MDHALLALEDGTVFEGRSFGARQQRFGEVVFNTSITGYQEVFTDPSYAGQIVCLTNPQIGNYGANPDDSESARPYIEGLIVREFSSIASNWRSAEPANEFLARHDIPVIGEIDTRKLVRKLRIGGVLRGVIGVGDVDPKELVERAKQSPSMTGRDLATQVTTPGRYEWSDAVKACSPSERIGTPRDHEFHVVAYDYGIKRNILRRLTHAGCKVTVVPASTSAEDALSLKPDGVFLSNGPGDPEPLEYQAAQVRNLIGKTPIFGICLGHQILGLAVGGKTFKLKFGHRGANHPVLNYLTNKVEITSQNHGFAVDAHSLKDSAVQLTHINLNDQTVEGLRLKEHPVFCVQYHPEAAPGPHDSHYLFDDFMHMMREYKKS
ncbi:MAG TPA: glutamine-hydrolyzing carbamoyl-phosphate synthase small subunit [Bryobacteraceae bacterium]|nr:glutamine-hydrolyzing carbamoyl-phosphate synthase small subunit [Bryobacteraceae bacterium]